MLRRLAIIARRGLFVVGVGLLVWLQVSYVAVAVVRVRVAPAELIGFDSGDGSVVFLRCQTDLPWPSTAHFQSSGGGLTDLGSRSGGT